MMMQELRHTLTPRQYEKVQKLLAEMRELDLVLRQLALDWVEDAGLPIDKGIQYNFTEDRKHLVAQVPVQPIPGLPTDTNHPVNDVLSGGGAPVSPVPAD